MGKKGKKKAGNLREAHSGKGNRWVGILSEDERGTITTPGV